MHLLLMFIYLLFLDEWKGGGGALSSLTHPGAGFLARIQPALSRSLALCLSLSLAHSSVMRVAHSQPRCPRSSFPPTSAPLRSSCGCRGNRGDCSPPEVGEAFGCVAAGGCVVRLLTCGGAGGGANSAEELLPAQSGSCSGAAPSEPLLLPPSAPLATCPPLSPSPPLPRSRRRQTMDKGSPSQSRRFVRGGACRAAPALVSEAGWGSGGVWGGSRSRTESTVTVEAA